MVILLKAVGMVDSSILDRLKDGLSSMFKDNVCMGGAMPDPDYAYNKKRHQYLATEILDVIIRKGGLQADSKILGIVDRDLYVPELNFVFGLAQTEGAVISLARLRQGFYGLPENKALFHHRVLIEAVHELGHTFGLGHCDNHHCVMFFSNCLSDTDRKGAEFCESCKGRLT